MRRALISLSAALALVAGVVVATALPASANAALSATSVALDGANCGNADLAVGITDWTADNEAGLITNAAGDTLGSYDQSAGPTGTAEVAGIGQPVDPEQPDATVIGSYYTLGTTPLSSANTAEWFVLYSCGTEGDNVVLYSCFGDLGTCPTTAVEALALIALDATLDPSTVAPGGTVTVNGTNCFDTLAGALLLKNGSATGVGDTVTPNPDGTFSIPLVVPADATLGGDYSVRVDCGNEQVIADTITLPLQVAVPTTTTVAVAAEVTPAFTG